MFNEESNTESSCMKIDNIVVKFDKKQKCLILKRILGRKNFFLYKIKSHLSKII